MRTALLLSSLLLASCGSTAPANVAGNYSLNFTNDNNGCNYANWTKGAMSTVSVAITQNGNAVQAVVQGVVAAYLDVTFGSHTFSGTVDGDQLSLTLQGSNGGKMGNCVYTINAQLAATASSDFLTGTINYTDATNNNSDCATLQGCQSQQTFNGSRPPPGTPAN
jgi:hypothetical protein